MKENKVRQSNFELLRIISILMIIAHHFAYRSEMQFDTSVIDVNRLWTQLLYYGGHVGLDVFVIISGYFLVDSKRLNLSKIARIWLELLFYSVGLYYLIYILGIGMDFFNEFSILRVFTPVSSEIWPFASAYCGLMVLYPFVNRLIKTLSKNSFRVLLAIMLLFWSVIPTFSSATYGCSYLMWMVTLYMVAGYIKLYPEDFQKGKVFYRRVMFILWGLSFASAVVLDVLGLKYEVCARYATHFSGMQHINIVVIAICLFLTFRDVKIENPSTGSVINVIAGTTFGVYLIHDNPFLSMWIWKQLFRNAEYINEWWFVVASIGEVIAIFAACMVIEFARQNLLEKWYMKGINKLLEKPQKFLDDIMNR